MKNRVLELFRAGGRQLNEVNLMNNLSLCIFCGVDVVKGGCELHLQLTRGRGNLHASCLATEPRQEVAVRPLNSRTISIPET